MHLTVVWCGNDGNKFSKRRQWIKTPVENFLLTSFKSVCGLRALLNQRFKFLSVYSPVCYNQIN
jgi:hypothetical protein